jgi:CRP-like cAMP-binding protein
LYTLGAFWAGAMDHHLITRNRLLAALAPNDFSLLAPQLTAFSLDEGAILQEADSPIDEIYFPTSGLISLATVMRTGEMVETAMVGREGAIGSFAGLTSAQTSADAPARAVVQIPGTAAAIPASRLRAAVIRSDGLRQVILQYNECLMALVQQTAACSALHGVEARLARWLLQALDRGDGATLALTQESLSQALGVRRTTLTLIACKFRDLGLIRYQRGRIDVVNRPGLEKAACECYATLRRRSDGTIGQAAEYGT